MLSQVLVVDDDPLTCELISEILRSAGMEAIAETDSAQAARRIQQKKFHAVFLDMRMPPPDGIELVRQIRSSPVNASAIVVMITGEQDRTVMGRAFEAGVGLFLFKPIERTRLLRLIRAAEGPIERERRRYTRVQLRCKVSIEAGSDRLEGVTLDLSLGGIFAHTRRVLPPQTLVKVSLELESGREPLRSDARVMRTVGTDCMGLQFENMGEQGSHRLQEFLLPLILAAH